MPSGQPALQASQGGRSARRSLPRFIPSPHPPSGCTVPGPRDKGNCVPALGLPVAEPGNGHKAQGRWDTTAFITGQQDVLVRCGHSVGGAEGGPWQASKGTVPTGTGSTGPRPYKAFAITPPPYSLEEEPAGPFLEGGAQRENTRSSPSLRTPLLSPHTDGLHAGRGSHTEGRPHRGSPSLPPPGGPGGGGVQDSRWPGGQAAAGSLSSVRISAPTEVHL